MKTVLLPPADHRPGDRVPLDDDETHHLRVSRAADREEVAVTDGAGRLGTGRLILGKKDAAVELETLAPVPEPPALVLGVGGGDRERFAWLVEKAAEIGVTELVPLDTDRAVNVASRVRSQHVEKLRRRAREAVKQSRSAWAPRVREPESLARFLQHAAGARWLLDAQGEAPPATLGDEPLTLVCGPEGGLTAGERATLLAAGFHPVRLGPHVLRFESAAFAGAVAAQVARQRGRA